MISKEFVENAVLHIFSTYPGNVLPAEEALIPEAAGIPFFEEPIVGIGSAEDPLFEKLKEETAVGPWYMTPKEWYPEAKSVISIFFPLSAPIRKSNRTCTDGPSPQWLHGRIEGQAYIMNFAQQLCQWLGGQGVGCCFPGGDERFKVLEVSSNWSERHAAYICGLGTFGLSNGLITRKGIAGRFVSVIVNQEIPADTRDYEGIFDYCTMCGACVRRCPLQSIHMERGNDTHTCHTQIQAMKKKHAPRYGCGICQTGVPCEDRIPK